MKTQVNKMVVIRTVENAVYYGSGPVYMNVSR